MSGIRQLERRPIGGEIVLTMADGSTQRLFGNGDYALDLFARACRGDKAADIDLVRRSISSDEPGGSHLIELARALLNGPVESTATADAGEQ
jgi:hypothetical protein